jgi:hypothetical protein
MKKIINICDFYKKPITLPIELEYRYSTILGFITTLLTFLTFALHFYFESYEDFDRKHPNIFSNKNNAYTYNKPTLKMSNETLKFFININISPFKENLLKYFDLSASHYDFGIYNKTGISFDICDENDLAVFRNHFEDFNFPEGINLCPKINFLIPATSFDEFEIYFY